MLEKIGLDPAHIDDVAFAQSYINSEAPCIGRWAAPEAGLPLEVPGALSWIGAAAVACSLSPRRP